MTKTTKAKSAKPIDGKKMLDDMKRETKQEQKEENKMNKKIDWKTVRTVFFTLVFVAYGAAAFYQGTQFQDSIHNSMTSQMRELSAANTIEVEKPSKQ